METPDEQYHKPHILPVAILLAHRLGRQTSDQPYKCHYGVMVKVELAFRVSRVAAPLYLNEP